MTQCEIHVTSRLPVFNVINAFEIFSNKSRFWVYTREWTL